MKQLFCTMVLFSFLQACVADELRPVFSDDPLANAAQSKASTTSSAENDNEPPARSIPPDAALESDASLNAPVRGAAQDPPASWKPRLLISLDIQANGASKMQPREVTSLVPVYTEKNGRRELAYRSVVNTYNVQVPNQAVLVADEVDISVAPADTGTLSYNVECAGRARFLLSGMIVTCDSFSLKEGTATCMNAAIQSGNVNARSESLELQLNVLGIKTTPFDQPAESLMAIPAHVPSPSQLNDAPTYPAGSNSPPPRDSFRPPQSRNFEVDAGPPSFDTRTESGNRLSPPPASDRADPGKPGNFDQGLPNEPAPAFQRS